ncbi:hypothetical protein FF1_034597 [Malus domestica]
MMKIGDCTSNDDVEEKSSTSGTKTTIQSARFEIEKFDETNNFAMWQCEVRDVLIQQGLIVVLGDMLFSMKKEEWKRLNAHAYSTIRLCLGKRQKYGVMNITSAKELCAALETKYMKKSVENQLHLKSKLYRYKEGTKMIGHLEEFNKLLVELANLEEIIKDEDNALILMNSLPESYQPFGTTWIYGWGTIKYDEISSALMNHEVRHLDIQERNNSEALMVRGRSKEKKGLYRKNNRFRTRGVSKNRKFLDKDECAFCHEK